MRKLVALALVLLLAISYPLGMVDAQGGTMVINEFADGRENLVMQTDGSIGNSSVGVNVPKDAVVSRAVMEVGAVDHILEREMYLDDFDGVWGKEHSKFGVENEMGTLVSRGEMASFGYSTEDGFANTTLGELDLKDGRLQLNTINGTWTQIGFQDGPGQNDWSAGQGFKESHHIDYTTREGPIRLLPRYTWTMFTDGGSGIPQPRGFMGMAINESESDIYIYGGVDGGFNSRYGNSYIMNVSLYNWDNLCNNCQPGVSYNNTLIWNGLNKSVQVVGGKDDGQVTLGLNWEYQSGGSGWDQMMDIVPRSSHSHVFIPSDNISILFGGMGTGPQEEKTIFHYENDKWTDETSTYSNVPPARYGHSAVWDPDGRRMIVFGGQGSGGPMKDVHVLNLDNKTWTSGSTPNFAARHSHTAVWDREARAMLVFGGNDGNQILRDMWMYWPSNDSWMQLPDNNVDKWGHGAVYSNSRGSMYVWGGYEDLSANGNQNSGVTLEKNYADRESELYSSVFNAQERVLWTRLTFEGEGFGTGTDGNVNLYYRVGDQPDPDQGGWSEWSRAFNETDTNLTGSDMLRGQYAQYKIVMWSTDRLHNLQIDKVVLYYFSHVNEGHMTTDVLDLGIIPEAFTSLNLNGEFPPNTGWKLTINTSEDGLTDWFDEVIYSLEEIQFAVTARFMRLTLTLWTNDSSATPLLDELSLQYSYYNPEGFFTIPVDNGGKQVDWIFADWDGVEDNMSSWGPWGLVSVSLDGGMTWHILTAGEMWYNPEPDDRNITTSILVNFTLFSEGDIPALFFDFYMDYGLFSFPVDIKLDVGDDGTVDWEWPGLHWSGDNSLTTDLSTEFQQYLVLNQGKASDAGEIFIPLHFGAADDCGIWLDKLEVRILVDNYPPKITSDPMTEANVGYKYEYRFGAEDQDGDDLEFFLDVHPEGMILEQEERVLKWVPSIEQMGSQNVVLRVSDGTDEAFQHFSINVSDSMKNEVPKFVSVPPDDINPMTIEIEVNAGKEYKYQIIVIDLDFDDLMNLEVTIFQGDRDMSIDSDLIFRWVAPLDEGRRVDVTLLVSDQKAYSLQQFTMVVVEPANHPPFFVDEVPREFQLDGGETFSYQVEAEDPEKKDLFYRVEDAPSWVNIGPNGLIVADPPNKDDRSTFTVIVSDGEDEVEAIVVFNVISQDDPRPPGPAEDDVRGALFLLGLLMIIVIAVVAIMVARKRKAARTKEPAIPDPGPREMPDDGPLPGPAPGPGPDDGVTPHAGPTTTTTTKAAAMGVGATAAAPAAKPTPPPAAAVDMRPEDKPIIEDVYLIYNDGRLIAHEARSIRPDMDEYVISGMLKAITDFVKDSLRREGSLGGLDYGDYRIVIEKGSYATLALVIIGKESSALREMVKRTLEKIQGLYSGVIEDWDGDTLVFSEVRNHLLPLILLGRTLEEDAQLGNVRVMSALEFYQGFVRLKVAIKNKYPYMVHDASLKLIHDKKALQLSHIEPEYNMEGMEVEIGNISPKEKKTVAFYLDPLICMESNIDASVMYKNYKGEIKTEMMKRRPVDIVCPIFYTEQNVNVAMLKRLINELKYRDSKLYNIPKGLTPELALSLAKETVQAHDVRFVREFEEQTPYIGEAWFYGKTKQTLEDLVIRVTVRADSNTMEMFVFSSNLATLPGLLADLAHGLKRGYKAKRSTKEDLSQITDTTVKDQLEKSSLLIDKYATSEMDTESDEIDI